MSSSLKRHILILAVYAALTLLMTLPVGLHLTTQIAGSGGDPWQTLWRFETKWQAFPGSLVDDLIGRGEPRLVNLSVWPWMPIHAIFGEPLGYNIIWLLSFVLSGYGMFLLASYLLNLTPNPLLGKERGNIAAFLAGMYYMFLPFHVAHAQGHFGAMQMQWLPFILLTGLWLLKRPNIWKTILLAILITIQTWTEQHYALWLVFFCLPAALFYHQQVKMKVSGTFIYIALLVGMILLTVILPYTPTFALARAGGEVLALGQEQTIRFSADPFAYIIPASWHPLWGRLAEYLFIDSYTGNLTEATQFLGIVPLLLLLFFHQQIPRRQKKFWLLIMAIFTAISLGPRLHVLGRITAIPLPYALIDQLPVFSSIRTIARAGVLVGLSMSVLLAWILTAEIKRRMSAVIVFLVVVGEFLFVPALAQSARLSPVYERIAALPGRSLIEIPAATNYTIASRALYASSLHHKAVLGNIALERGANAEGLDLRSVPGLRHVLYGGANRLLLDRPEDDGSDMTVAFTQAATTYDARVILIHTDSISPRQLQALRHFFEERLHLNPDSYSDALLYTLAP